MPKISFFLICSLNVILANPIVTNGLSVGTITPPIPANPSCVPFK